MGLITKLAHDFLGNPIHVGDSVYFASPTPIIRRGVVVEITTKTISLDVEDEIVIRTIPVKGDDILKDCEGIERIIKSTDLSKYDRYNNNMFCAYVSYDHVFFRWIFEIGKIIEFGLNGLDIRIYPMVLILPETLFTKEQRVLWELSRN